MEVMVGAIVVVMVTALTWVVLITVLLWPLTDMATQQSESTAVLQDAGMAPDTDMGMAMVTVTVPQASA